jgi:hypothetical protein
MYTIFLGDQLEAEKIIGLVGLNRWDQVHYILDPKFSGLGYSTEALTAFLIALFELQPKRLSIGTVLSSENLASKRVLEKCGFVPGKPKREVSMPESTEISEQDELKELKSVEEYAGPPKEEVLTPGSVEPLGKDDLDELKNVVKSLGLPNAPIIQPQRPAGGHGSMLFFVYVKPSAS